MMIMNPPKTTAFHLILVTVVCILTGCTTAPDSSQDEPPAASDGVEPTETVEYPHLRQKLLEMAERDQALRQRLTAADLEAPDEDTAAEVRALAIAQAEDLEEIIHRLDGWPDHQKVGTDGAHAAWLIAQHADPTPELQRIFRDELRRAVDANRAPAEHLAYLVDRIRRNNDEPQLYGTQFNLVDGELVLEPVENPDDLDERRAEMGLPPMAEYKELMRQMISPPNGD